MKTILLRMVFLAIAVIGTAFASNAQANLDFYITINDTCQGDHYSGTYCAQWYIVINSNHVCTHTDCTLKAGINHIKYQCTIQENDAVCNYYLQMVFICRNTSPS